MSCRKEIVDNKELLDSLKKIEKELEERRRREEEERRRQEFLARRNREFQSRKKK